jgi:hypothetical protein
MLKQSLCPLEREKIITNPNSLTILLMTDIIQINFNIRMGSMWLRLPSGLGKRMNYIGILNRVSTKMDNKEQINILLSEQKTKSWEEKFLNKCWIYFEIDWVERFRHRNPFMITNAQNHKLEGQFKLNPKKILIKSLEQQRIYSKILSLLTNSFQKLEETDTRNKAVLLQDLANIQIKCKKQHKR